MTPDSDKISLDKSEWVQQKKCDTIKKGVITNVPFDIWIYGNDFDMDRNKSEHNIYLIDISGSKVKVGEIANDISGDSVNRAYVIKGLDSTKFIYNKDNLELHIANPKGDWIQSTFYAVYIMPHKTNINSNIATITVENNIDKLREHSFGFTEYCYYGLKDFDGLTLKLSISLYDTHSLTPPQNVLISN